MEAYQSFAQVYDQMMADMPYDQWLSFTQSIISKQQWQQQLSIVDLGCGTGQVTKRLANSGYKVTGIDLSDAMLSMAKQSEQQFMQVLEQANQAMHYVPITWKQQNMVNWYTDEQVDLVLSYCDSINYLLHEDDVLALFYSTYEQLKPSGIFAFDCHPITRFEQYAQQQPFAYDDGEFSYIWFSEYDEEDAIIEHDLTIYAKVEGETFRRIDETHVQRAYSMKWLEQALLEVGFTSVQVYEDFTFNFATAAAQRLFFVATK